MNRICEELKHQVVLPPSAVTTATLTTTAFVDCSNVPEVEFLVSTGALASGKKLTVGIYTSAVAAGTSAVKVSEVVFTADGALNSALVAASYEVKATGGRYVGIKFKHDAGADVICAVTASARSREIPAESGWSVKA